MKYNNRTTEEKGYIDYWLQLCDSYFEATITAEEEKALKAFLATPASNTQQFNEIKAVMGYIATGKATHTMHHPTASKKRLNITGWVAAASVALLAISGTLVLTEQKQTEKDICFAFIDGQRYTDKDFVLQQMHSTMSRISRTTSDNTIEEQLGSMLRIAD